MAPGTTIDLKVLRDGTERKYSITLDTMPASTERAEESQPYSVPRRGGRG